MQKENYAFITINTTGCRPTIDRIFEIGICSQSALDTFERWHKLINPEVTIPSSIQQLTEFSADIVANASVFSSIANELVAILKNKIIVTKNARLVSSFLRNELKRCGIKWQGKVLCLSKLMQEFPRLEQALVNCNNHVVESAIIKAQYFYEKFFAEFAHTSEAAFNAVVKRLIKQPSIPTYITNEFLQTIPKSPGVYKFYGENDSLLYIGKSISLQERIRSHFSATISDDRELKMAQQIRRIDWIETVGELGALLLEAKLVKQLMPIFNRKLRRYKGLFSIELQLTPDHYHSLKVAPCSQLENPEFSQVYGLFRQKYKAEQLLRRLVKEYGFCAKLSGLEKGKGPCFFYQLKICKGACVGKEQPEDYNQRLQQALVSLLYKSWPFNGKIAIKEQCIVTNKIDLHIVDQWSYVETVNDKKALQKIDNNIVSKTFDLDIYHILIKYFENYGTDMVVEL